MQKFYSLSFGVLTTLLVFWSSSSWLTPESSLPETIVANFIVDSASDAGDSNPGDGICDSGCCGCTLRAAIEESNATAAADVITFVGVNAVSPTFDLPIITNPLTINGGSTGGVVINGGAMTSSDFGLNIQSSNVSLYGLAIQNFADEGILIPSGGTYNNINIGDVNNGCVSIQNGQGLWVGANVDNLNIVGSFFGTDSGYHTGLGNTNNGIRLQSSGITNATIGGPTAAHGNVIGGNGSIGLEARCNVTIQNNIIGTDDVGTADLGNPINVNLFTLITTGSSLIDNNTIAFSGQSGISCEHDNVTITNNQIYSNTQRGINLEGNNCTISNNEIYSNNLVGVAIVGGTQNSLSQNEIYCNTPQGIFHSSNGNNNMPSPTITSASMSSVSGTAQANATIEVFIQDETGCLGLDCQGRTFVGLAAADGSGNWIMSAASMVAMPADGDQVIATATDASNNTSEFSTCLTVSSACTHPDYDALMALYNSTDGPNWTDNTGWVDGAAGTNCDPCNGWHGVTCNGNGRVDCIDLDGASGASECSIGGWSTVGNNLSGTIPVELEDLTELQSLNLSGNMLSGTIPDIFDGLPNLTNLLLEENQLTEPLPPSLYNATSLSRLVLRNNNISEPLSANFCNLTNLFSLILSQNNFTGTIPSCFGNWTAINILYLNSNNLSGTIPSSLGNLTTLGFLDISSNNLTGEMPSELGNLVSITNMQFAGNNLSGCFPSSYSALCPTSIDFGNNPLLPWEGDFSQFCLTDGSQAAQLGAPCNDGDAGTTGETIQNDCSCAFVSACPTGTTVTVTNTNDDGDGSLREAINCVNADPLLDNIEFNIMGTPPFVINLVTVLPDLTDDGVTINGVANGNVLGDIVIDGGAINSDYLLEVFGDNFSLFGIHFDNNPSAIGSGALYLNGSNNSQIGSNSVGNLFTNGFAAMVLALSSSNCVVEGNTIGTNLAVTQDLGFSNSGISVIINSNDNIIRNNTIAYTTNNAAILINQNANRNLVSNNTFICNVKGIDLNLANDAGNLGIDAPIITSASSNEITGTAGANETIEVYISSYGTCTSIVCQGRTFLGTTTSDVNGNWTLSSANYQVSVSSGDDITATTTDTNNNTSEFADCLTIAACPTGTTVTVTNTNDSGDGSLREAINCVNADPLLDIIEFNINGTPPFVISLASALPNITDDNVALNVNTQPGWTIGDIAINGQGTVAVGLTVDGNGFSTNGLYINSCWNTQLTVNGLNASIDDSVFSGVNASGVEVRLQGNGATFINSKVGTTPDGLADFDPNLGNMGLRIEASNVTVDNSVFSGNSSGTSSGIFVAFNDPGQYDNITITNNKVGTDINGQFAIPNSSGISLTGATNSTLANNIVCGNNGNGIALSGCVGGTIENNEVGVSGTIDIPNAGEGIAIRGVTNFGGSTDLTIGPGNIVANNDRGVTIGVSCERDLITQNQIFCNTNDGIWLFNVGNQNKPSPTITTATTAAISGTADPGDIIEVFEQTQACQDCQNNNPQARTYLGSATADGTGNWNLNGTFTLNSFVTATATDANNNTSIFANCAQIATLDTPFTIDFTATTPSCQEGTSGYVPDATIDITVNDPTTCGGAVYDIVLTPIPNSSPSGTTPNNVTPAGFFGVPAGTYSFAAAGSGDYDVVVTEVGGPCNPPVNPETIVANVLNGPAPSNINPTPVGPFCEGDPIVNLNPIQGGFTGSWSGPGIACCNEFDPSALGAGDWDVLFTPDDGQCANAALLTITINPLPTANEVALEACDEGGGQATFNLTTADSSIDPLGNPVSWFEDVALTTPIVNPVSYFASSTTVYAVVNNGFCSSLPVGITLTANPTPLSINTLLAECEIGNGEATFNLNSVNSIVNGGAGFQVEWYLDPNGFTPVPNPNNYSSSSTTVYAIVNNGLCVSAAAEVELIVIPNTVIVPDPIGPYCDTDPVVSLPTVQSGIPGSWSGIGIDCCNEFNPSTAGAGTATLTFTPNGGECANPVQVNVIVAITQTLTFSGLQLEFCDTDAAYQLPNFSDNGTPGSWDIGNTFDPPLFTGTTTTITFTPVDNVCAFPYESDITVYAEPAILSIDAQNPDDCGVDNGSINITDALGVNLEYSINGGIDWQTNPDFCCLGAGTYNVVIREIGVDICEDTEVVTLTAPMAPVINDITLVDPSDCFETDGSIEVFATGVSLEYSIDGIIWQIENVFSNLPQGDYTIQVREVNSPDCIATQDVSLEDPPVPVILDIFLVNPSCDSNADGSITIIVQNAGASTEYSIDGGQNFFSENAFPALASGDYDVVVREAATMDCTTSQTVNLSALDAPTIVDVLSTDPSDCFETDGSIEVIATGITLEYSLDGIVWQNESIFSNLPQGNYTVQVREVNAPDCVSTEDVTLVDPPVPVILDIILTNPTDCSGGSADGQIEIIVQNAGASTEYSIDGGQNFFSENLFPALASGDYDVVVREAATMDCQTTVMVNLSGAAAPSIDDIVAVNPSDCFESDGSIEVFATGITLEYSLDGIVWQNENIFSNLPQGDYTVQVREVNAPDCISMQDVTLVDPPVPVILDIIITNDITCFGSDNGEIEIIVQNAGASTEYSIDGGQNFFSENFFPALAGGDYDVVVREAATMDCTTTQTINVATIDSPQTSCSQQSPVSSAGVNDGEAAIGIQGGTAPYTIDYSGPTSGNDNAATEGTYVFNGLAEGTYTFTVTDNNGCFETCTVVIEVADGNNCNHPDYDALMAFYNATDGPNWTNNDGWAEGAAGNNCEPCTWFGVACDVNDRVTCIVLDQSDPANVNCSPFGFNTNGNNLTGSLPGEMQELIALEHLNLTGNNISGAIPEIFDGMDNFNALLMRGNSVESPLPSSLFSRQNLAFIDLRNNSLAESFPADLCNLTQLQRLLISSNDFTGEIPDCITDLTAITHFYASSNALSGPIPMDIGNIQGLTFLNLSNNNLTGPIPASLGALTPSSIFNLANNNLMGCYEDGLLALCGTSFDASGNPELPWEGDFQEFCDGNTQIGAPCNDGNDFTTGETIQQDCSCQLVVDCTDSDLTFAFGDLQGPSCGVADNGFAGVVPFLGVPPYTYLWSTGDTNPIAMNLSEGLYGFTITDSEGCTVDGQVNLMAINPIELVCPDDIEIIIEADENGILLDIPGPDTGICPADSVRHFAEGATVIPDSPGTIGVQFFDIGVTTVTYYVPGQDTCTFTVIVRQVEDPCDDFAVTPNQVQSPICNDGADGFIEISVSGGDGNYEFLWSNGAVTEDLTDLTVGLYTATITDGMGCEVSVSFWLQEESELDLSCEGIPFSNYGQMASSVQVFASGGQAPYTIDFDGPVSGSLPDQSEGEIFLDDLPEGDYGITLTDADGCMKTCATSITNPCTTFVCPDDIILFIEADSTGILLDIPGPDVGDCGLDLIQYNLEGATVQGDTPGAVGIQFFNVGVTTVSYFVPGKDTCTFNIEILKVTDPCDDFAVIPNQVQSPLCEGDANGMIEITVLGGDGNYIYEWSNGETSQDLANLPVGLYTVTIMDGNGCEVSASFWLQGPNAINLVCDHIPGSGTVSFDLSGGTGPYNVDVTGPENFTFSDINEGFYEIEDTPAGDYTITIIDTNGCTVSCNVSVVDDVNCDDVGFNFTLDNSNCLFADGSANVMAFGGSGDYSYEWSNGTTNPMLTNVFAGTYGLTITDDVNGCIVTTDITIPNIGEAQQFAIEETICAGESYLFDGEELTEPDVYTAMLMNQFGCDSIVTLTLNVVELEVEILGDPTYCEDEIGAHRFEIDWDGDVLWSTGSAEDFVDILPANGSLSVTITDGNGCTAVDEIDLSIIPSPEVEITGLLEVCGDELTEVIASGGVNYEWSTGEFGPVAMLPSGIHAVSVTNAEGCITVELVEIIENGLPILPIYDPIAAICFGIIPELSIDNPLPDFIIDWFNENNEFLGSGNTFQPEGPGNYFAQVRNILTGCVSIELAMFQVFPDTEPPVFENCPGDDEIFVVVWNTAQDPGPTISDPAFIATDNCSDVDILTQIVDTAPLGQEGCGPIVVTGWATDASGNTSMCSYEIEVVKTDDLTFFIDTANIDFEDNIFDVPVLTRDFNNVSGFQFTMMISDTSGGAFLGLTPLAPELEDGLSFNIQNDSTMRILWSDVSGNPNQLSLSLPDSTPIFSIQLNMPGEPGDCDMLMFADDPVNKVAIRDNVGEVIPGTIDGEVCIPEIAFITGRIHREDDQGVKNVEVSLISDEGTLTAITDTDGNYFFDELPLGLDYTIVPFKNDNHPNGLSLVDITRVRDYILFGPQSQFLETPYRKISADATNNTNISLTDLTTLIVLRISGPDAVLPNNTSWRFVDADHEFQNPDIPWLGGFPEEKFIASLNEDSTDNDFIAMKIGDVNLTAATQLFPSTPHYLELADQELVEGQTVLVPINAKHINNLIGLELDLVFDPTVMKLEQIIPGDLPMSDFRYNEDRFREGVLSGLWLNMFGEDFGAEEMTMFYLEFTAKEDGQLSELLGLGYEYMESIGVTNDHRAVPLELVFTDQAIISSINQVDRPEMQLMGAYPNPFDESTNIQFFLPEAENVQIELYDLSGKVHWVESRDLSSGYQEWLIGDQELSTEGIYFYRLSANGREVYGKLIKQ